MKENFEELLKQLVELGKSKKGVLELSEINDFLKYGVTTVDVISCYGLDWENEKKQLVVVNALQ